MKTVTFLLTLLLAVCLSTAIIFSADHRESPLLMGANNPLATADINDIYAFVNSTNLILVITVSPFAPAGAKLFDSAVTYTFFVDTDNDGFENLAVYITVDDAGNVTMTGDLACRVTRTFAGRRDDPFFFDPEVLNKVFGRPRTRRLGTNMFGPRADIGAIVLEIPINAVTPSGPNIGIWGETRKCGLGLIDRMGRPGIATVFIPLDMRNAFNQARPGQDVQKFNSFIGARFPHVSFLLPDILTIDTSRPTGYPNGRGLADDVIDGSLQLILQNTTATDSVANDSQFLTTFPFLGPPQVTSVNERRNDAPADFDLMQSYPNPFNPSAKIDYALPVRGNVILKIYNLLGVEVRTLVDATQTAGQHTVTWDGKDDFGRDVVSGIYLYRLEAKPEFGSESLTMSRRMVLMR